MLKSNIEKLRLKKGISINQMAKDLDMRYGTLHNIVTKDNLDTIPLRNIVRLASYFEVDVESLYTK